MKKIFYIFMFSILSILLILPISFSLSENRSYGEEENIIPTEPEMGEAKEGTPAGPISPEMVEKANQYIISLIGEEYFKNKFILYKSISDSSSGSSGVVIYNYFLGQVSLRINSNGIIREYIGPTKPYSLNINKEEAIRIAKSRGLQEPIDAQLVYGGIGFSSDNGSITESYIWDISSSKISKGNLEIVYVDIDTGDVIGVKTFEYIPLHELTQSTEEVNKTNKQINKSIEEVNKTSENLSKRSFLSNIINFFKSIFKK